MYFNIQLADFNLVKACINGMDGIRDKLWNRCLEETKAMWEHLPEVEEDSVRKQGLESIEALHGKNTAKDAGAIAKATRRYSYEERLRGKMSAAIETLLPFSWKCNWSYTEMQRRAQEICLLLDPLLTSRKSRLLPFFPISVVASIMDCVYRGGADKPSWWKNKGNISEVIRKSSEYMKEGMETTVTGEVSNEEKLVSICVGLVSEIVRSISPSFLKNKTLSSLAEGYGVVESAITSRVEGGSKNTLKSIYVGKENIERLLNHVSFMSPILAAEFRMFFLTQKVVVALDEGKNVLEKFCYVDNKQDEELFCIDPLILDVVYLLRDITATIKVVTAKENEGIVVHLMNVLAEKPIEGKHVSFRKLFMVGTALMKGLKEDDVNLTDISEGIISKMGRDGVFTVKRKPWKRLAVEERKRAPKLQPGIIVVNDNDDDGAKTRKATTKEKKREGGSSRGSVSGKHIGVATGEEKFDMEVDVESQAGEQENCDGHSAERGLRRMVKKFCNKNDSSEELIEEGNGKRKKRAREENSHKDALSDVFGSDIEDCDSAKQEEPTRSDPIQRRKHTKKSNTGKRRKRS